MGGATEGHRAAAAYPSASAVLRLFVGHPPGERQETVPGHQSSYRERWDKAVLGSEAARAEPSCSPSLPEFYA